MDRVEMPRHDHGEPVVALLQPEAFFLGCDLIFAQLRLKEADRWSEGVALLKLASFTTAFPEVNDRQFLWACEQWCQGVTNGSGFRCFPPWVELVAPLYRRENGLANRSWGFNPNLPHALLPTAQQIAMLPRQRRSLVPTDDPAHDRWLPPANTTAWSTPGGITKQLPPGGDGLQDPS